VARERVRAHLDACADCRAELEALEGLGQVLRDTPPHEPEASYWERFADRVEARLPQVQVPSRTLVERLSAWLLPGGRLDWPRAVGAAATVTLVVFVSVLGLRQDPSPVTSEGSPEVALAPAPAPEPKSDPEQGRRKEAPTKASQSPPRRQGRTAAESPREALAPERGRAEPEEVASAELPEVLHGAPTSVDEADALPPAQAGETRFALEKKERSNAPATAARQAVATEELFDAPAPQGVARMLQSPAAPIVHAFVTAALAADSARAREHLSVATRQASVHESDREQMRRWLGGGSAGLQSGIASSRLGAVTAESAAHEGWLALDALVWPRREDPTYDPLVRALALELTSRASASTAVTERARAYLEWLEERDPAGGDSWRALRERLPRRE
jgi:hypothetical protein